MSAPVYRNMPSLFFYVPTESFSSVIKTFLSILSEMWWLLFYCLFLLATCIAKTGNCFNAAQYYVCDRNASSGLVSFSILASSVGGSATLGMAGLVWQAGTPGFWWLGAGVIGLFLLGLLFARKIRSSRARTLPELCEKSLGPGFRLFCALLIFIAYVPIVAAQFSAQALIIAGLTGFDFSISLMLGALVLFAYTFIGGQNAVMKSDRWQFIILLGALLLILYTCLQNNAGKAAILTAPVQLTNSDFPTSRLFYFLLILGSSFIIGPMLFGRVLSARSQRHARAACFMASGGLLIIASIITLIGLALQGILPAQSLAPSFNPENILNIYIKNSLPPTLAIICFLGLFSAIISSADSCLFTASSIFANDLRKKPTIRECRIAMILVTLGALFLSFQGKGILNLLFLANDIYVCGVTPPVFLALLSGRKRTIKKVMLALAMISGGCFGAGATLFHIPSLSMFGLALSFIICLIGFHGHSFGLENPDKKIIA